MSEFSPVPDSISHKLLNSLLSRAHKQPINASDQVELVQEQEAFNQLLTNWASISEELLIELNKASDYVLTERDPKKLMALGVLKAHLKMALEAQKASEFNDE